MLVSLLEDTNISAIQLIIVFDCEEKSLVILMKNNTYIPMPENPFFGTAFRYLNTHHHMHLKTYPAVVVYNNHQ